MDEVDSNVNQTKRGGSKEWLNKKVGNAPRNSRHVFCRDDEDEDCHSREISNNYHERNSVRSLKSNSSNDDQDRERRRSFSDDEDEAVMIGGRKKSFEVMSEDFADLGFEESIGFNKHSNTNSSEACSRPRRRSFCDDEEAEEIQELVKMGSFTSSEGERRIESMKLSRAAYIPSYSKMRTDQRNGDESQRFHSDFLLVPLLPGDKDYDDICDEMYSAGLDLIKVERLKNQMSFDRFESEKEIIAKGRKPECSEENPWPMNEISLAKAMMEVEDRSTNHAAVHEYDFEDEDAEIAPVIIGNQTEEENHKIKTSDMVLVDVPKYAGEWPQIGKVVKTGEESITIQWFKGSKSTAWSPCTRRVAGKRGKTEPWIEEIHSSYVWCSGFKLTPSGLIPKKIKEKIESFDH